MTDSANPILPPSPSMRPEVLSPAGGMPALKAALAAGADAVYGGLKHLNARAGAANFTKEELRTACRLAHENNAKFYLTLNIDLSQRELGLAARSLAVARECGVDAVLIRDPALLALQPFFPELPLHFSTQAGISSSAGVAAAKELGVARVVLARELSMEEIAAATGQGVETEIFVQGALCFSCSGRCLLSSWGGGRSGNRGACTSPCRVLWTTQDGRTDRFLSMHDLCAIPEIDALAKAGVSSLKIEGRLKSPEWVGEATRLYRKAVDAAEPPSRLLQEAESLGNYTGRLLSDGYLRGERRGLTGDSRRTAANRPRPADPPQAQPSVQCAIASEARGGLLFQFSLADDSSETYRIPPQRIANPKRAIPLAELLRKLHQTTPEDWRPDAPWTPPQELAGILLPKSAGNALGDFYAAWLRSLAKEVDDVLKGTSLPAPLMQLLGKTSPRRSPRNTRPLGSQPDTVRFNWNETPRIPPGIRREIIHVFPQDPSEAEMQVEAVLAHPDALAALPQVVYEGQLPAIRRAIHLLTLAGRVLELNSWDEWWLARQEGARFCAGEGLPVLNALAASVLADLGFENLLVSCEIDRTQLECLSEAASAPLSVTVFSRPPLMHTRAVLPVASPLRETRGTTLLPSQEGAVTVLRPATPMDWRNLHSRKVTAEHLILDLRGFRELPPPEATPFLFNYDRRLR